MAQRPHRMAGRSALISKRSMRVKAKILMVPNTWFNACSSIVVVVVVVVVNAMSLGSLMR